MNTTLIWGVFFAVTGLWCQLPTGWWIAGFIALFSDYASKP